MKDKEFQAAANKFANQLAEMALKELCKDEPNKELIEKLTKNANKEITRCKKEVTELERLWKLC